MVILVPGPPNTYEAPVVNGKSVAGRPSSGVVAFRIDDDVPTWFRMDAGPAALHQTPMEGHGPG